MQRRKQPGRAGKKIAAIGKRRRVEEPSDPDDDLYLPSSGFNTSDNDENHFEDRRGKEKVVIEASSDSDNSFLGGFIDLNLSLGPPHIGKKKRDGRSVVINEEVDYDCGRFLDDLNEVERKKKKKRGAKKKRKGKLKDVVEEDNGEELGDIDIDEMEVTRERNRAVRVPHRRSRRRKNERKKKKGSGKDLWWETWEKDNEEWVDANQSKDFDFDANEEGNIVETLEPPRDLVVPLFRFQKEWLAWALKQEGSEIKGGILADEMGMGKTIQAISLVLATRVTHPVVSGSINYSPGSSRALPEVKCTLVVCPLVAVTQWVSEIAKFTAEGSTKVLVYHGAKRLKDIELFNEYDFVLTTYSTVEADYRVNVMPPKEKCKWCGKLYYPKKMIFHLKYFCGPDAVKTDKQSKQMKKKVKSAFKGRRATKTPNQRKNVRVSSPTHHSMDTGGDSSAKKSVLHSVKWRRIILDEAHFIKDRRSNTARAVFSLESSYKWALSGTPLQNRVGELYSLIRFLQVFPYSFYFCKDCDCKTLDYSSTVTCPGCIHSSTRHFCWWNRYVAKPIQGRGYSDEGRRAMILLKQKLLQSLVLRRTKKGRAADLSLPPRLVSVRRDILDSKEEDFYEALYTQSQAQFNTYIDSGTVMNNYAHIFDLLTRLRQAVDHPYLVIYSKTRANETSENERGPTVVDDICDICHDPAEDPQITSCGHVFCKACLVDYTNALECAPCPSCLKPLTVDLREKGAGDQQSTIRTIKGSKQSILGQIRLEDFQTSTKIEALREEVRFMIENDGSSKGIVFSQFTSFLELIKYSLQKSGVKCVQLDGSMSITAKDHAIRTFTDDPDCKIFLVSLKAGGVALNLTVASYVFVMDPWWNPAVEQQAQDRIHRIGQYRPIRVVRFVIENTIEERILRLQDKKQLVFEGTVGGSSQALVKLTEADLKFLFQM